MPGKPINILGRELAVLQQLWGLERIPFRDVPPADPAELMRYFVGREEEIEIAVPLLYDGRNILVQGIRSIGKTAFILATLYRLQQDARAQCTHVLPIHITEFRGGEAEAFYRVVLYGLARGMAAQNRRARNVLRALVGEETVRGYKGAMKAGLGFHAFTAAEAEIGVELEREASRTLRIGHTLHFLNELLEEVQKKNWRVVIALDDLDKVVDQKAVKEMLHDVLNLLRDERCAFILTGRPITIFEDIDFMSLRVVSEIFTLKLLTKEQLCKIAVRQLNTVRKEPRDDAFPISDEVLDEIAEKAMGLPGLFNRICERVLRFAVRQGYRCIGRKEFSESYAYLQADISLQTPPEIKRVLYHALQRGRDQGFLISKEADLDDVFSTLGVHTIYELLPYLDRLVENALMVRLEKEGEIRYVIAPGAERAAEEGGRVRL